MSSEFVDIELETLQERASSNPTPKKEREFRCSECNAWYIRLFDGHSEASHYRSSDTAVNRQAT